MKTLLTLFLGLATVGASAQIVFEEYFDNGMPESFVLENLDGLTPDDPDLATMADSAWTVRNITAQGFGGGSGSNAAFSVSWYEGDAGPSDDWMITNGIQLGADPYLNWSAMAITSSGDFRDQYQVFVVTEGQEIENFFLAAPLFDTGQTGEETEETFRSLSLADFANETVYIAFRNFTQPYDSGQPTGPGNGGNELAVDNIVVSEGPLSVSEFVKGEARVWPQPAQSELRFALPVSVQALEWSLVDASGRIVKQSSAGVLNAGDPVQLSVDDLKAGNYILHITADGFTAASRVMVR